MDIYTQLQTDMKKAMLEKNISSRDAIRAIIAEIKNKNIIEGKDITNDLCLNIIKKSVKQHNDSINQFKAANRLDLIEKEQNELNCLLTYLPKMFTEDEMIAVVSNIITENELQLTKQSFGLIMKQLNTHKNKDQIDKAFISKYLNTLLK